MRESDFSFLYSYVCKKLSAFDVGALQCFSTIGSIDCDWWFPVAKDFSVCRFWLKV